MNRDINTCYYCGLTDAHVEAGGVWHCPNLFCQGPGAFYGRMKAGYHGEDGRLHPDGEARMIADCACAIEIENDKPEWADAMRRSLAKMVERRAKRGVSGVQEL